MPKAKVAKKPVKKAVKKTIVAKSAPKLSKPVTKKHSLFFRLAIAAVLVFLAGSLYQLFANGTGPLSFFTGSAEVFVVSDGGNEGGVATCNLPESVCKTVNGCTWKPAVPAIPAVYDTTTIKCTDSNCPKGCKVSTKQVASTAPGQCEQAGLSQSKCSQLGFTWTPGKTIYTKVDTCTGTVEEDRLVKAEIAAIPGSCSGTPIVAAPPQVNPPGSPAPDPCASACKVGGPAGIGPGSSACKACANTNPDSPVAISINPSSVRLCCATEVSSNSCADSKYSYKGIKYTVSTIVRAGAACPEKQLTCPPEIDPAKAKVDVTYACAYGTRNGGVSRPSLTDDQKCNAKLAGAKAVYSLSCPSDQAYVGSGPIGTFYICCAQASAFNQKYGVDPCHIATKVNIVTSTGRKFSDSITLPTMGCKSDKTKDCLKNGGSGTGPQEIAPLLSTGKLKSGESVTTANITANARKCEWANGVSKGKWVKANSTYCCP